MYIYINYSEIELKLQSNMVACYEVHDNIVVIGLAKDKSRSKIYHGSIETFVQDYTEHSIALVICKHNKNVCIPTGNEEIDNIVQEMSKSIQLLDKEKQIEVTYTPSGIIFYPVILVFLAVIVFNLITSQRNYEFMRISSILNSISQNATTSSNEVNTVHEILPGDYLFTFESVGETVTSHITIDEVSGNMIKCNNDTLLLYATSEYVNIMDVNGNFIATSYKYSFRKEKNDKPKEDQHEKRTY